MKRVIFSINLVYWIYWFRRWSIFVAGVRSENDIHFALPTASSIIWIAYNSSNEEVNIASMSHMSDIQIHNMSESNAIASLKKTGIRWNCFISFLLRSRWFPSSLPVSKGAAKQKNKRNQICVDGRSIAEQLSCHIRWSNRTIISATTLSALAWFDLPSWFMILKLAVSIYKDFAVICFYSGFGQHHLHSTLIALCFARNDIIKIVSNKENYKLQMNFPFRACRTFNLNVD